MGADVAVVLTRALCRTTVVEPDAARGAALPARVAANLAAIGREDGAAALQVAADLDQIDWSTVDLVIECIPERLDLKQALFAELVRRARPMRCWPATVPAFPSAPSAPASTRARACSACISSCRRTVPLVEVVMGEGSSEDGADALIAFMRRCGMVPVKVRRDLPGFLANRLQHALSREAFSLIDRGIASPGDVDAAVRFGFGFRFGGRPGAAARPRRHRRARAAGATMYPSFCNDAEPARCTAERAADGRHGMKRGEGFYAGRPKPSPPSVPATTACCAPAST